MLRLELVSGQARHPAVRSTADPCRRGGRGPPRRILLPAIPQARRRTKPCAGTPQRAFPSIIGVPPRLLIQCRISGGRWENCRMERSAPKSGSPFATSQSVLGHLYQKASKEGIARNADEVLPPHAWSRVPRPVGERINMCHFGTRRRLSVPPVVRAKNFPLSSAPSPQRFRCAVCRRKSLSQASNQMDGFVVCGCGPKH
jgi:hypothetical protein